MFSPFERFLVCLEEEESQRCFYWNSCRDFMLGGVGPGRGWLAQEFQSQNEFTFFSRDWISYLGSELGVIELGQLPWQQVVKRSPLEFWLLLLCAACCPLVCHLLCDDITWSPDHVTLRAWSSLSTMLSAKRNPLSLQRTQLFFATVTQNWLRHMLIIKMMLYREGSPTYLWI